MLELQRILRPNIASLKPYSCARDEYQGEAAVMLDANENSFGSPISFPGGPELNRYPASDQKELKKRVAKLKGLEPDQVFLGVGSDEVMDLLVRACCVPGQDSIIITPPSYGMYQVLGEINDLKIKEVPLDENFQLNLEAVLSALDDSTKLIFLCSPNNPTGNVMSKENMIRLCQNFKGLVVVDEAYIDFAQAQESMLDQLRELPNLVILQTFSKAWGLAGIRLGMAFALPELIRVLMKIKLPYNVNTVTSFLALEALQSPQLVFQRIGQIRAERDRLRAELENFSSVEKVFPSDANFLLVRIANAKGVYEQLAARGIVTRYRGNIPGCEETIRVTIGTPEQNNQLLSALKSFL